MEPAPADYDRELLPMDPTAAFPFGEPSAFTFGEAGLPQLQPSVFDDIGDGGGALLAGPPPGPPAFAAGGLQPGGAVMWGAQGGAAPMMGGMGGSGMGFGGGGGSPPMPAAEAAQLGFVSEVASPAPAPAPAPAPVGRGGGPLRKVRAPVGGKVACPACGQYKTKLGALSVSVVMDYSRKEQPEQPAPFARHPHDTPLVSSGAQVWCEGCGKKADRHLIHPERQKSIPCAKWSRTGQRCCACAYALGQNDGGGSDRSNALSMPISSVSAFACSPRRAVPPPPLRPL